VWAQWCPSAHGFDPEALPEQTPKAQKNTAGFIQQKGIFVCGDHATSASIEGAVISGKRVAEAILKGRLPTV
jgi:predicted NAD/FAD-dependent oxidoreductase